MIKTTTRSRVAAEAIRDCRVFKTNSPNFYGQRVDRPGYLYSGHLYGPDADALSRDLAARVIDYVVWSYSTPIGWHRTDGTWHIVAQTFSVTTSKHQANLYLCGSRGARVDVRWQGMKGGVNQGYSLFDPFGDGEALAHADDKAEAQFLARYIRLNGMPPQV